MSVDVRLCLHGKVLLTGGFKPCLNSWKAGGAGPVSVLDRSPCGAGTLSGRSFARMTTGLAGVRALSPFSFTYGVNILAYPTVITTHETLRIAVIMMTPWVVPTVYRWRLHCVLLHPTDLAD